MKKKVNIFGKGITILAITLLLFGGFGIATLVGYLSNTITTSMEVESPLELVGTEFDFEVDYSGEDGFVLIKLTNRADVDITGDIEIAVDPDIQGIRLAVTEDINYCFAGLGDMTGVNSDCETNYMRWMENNIDWNDWEGSHAYSNTLYPSPLVVDTDGDSFNDVGYTGNTLLLEDATLPANTDVYGVIYISTNPALAPGTYTFDVTVVPV
ncbi:MAG: hypothetical protein ACTSPI_03545 [Candidatus Heimdallarchaeaceae archaeon]